MFKNPLQLEHCVNIITGTQIKKCWIFKKKEKHYIYTSSSRMLLCVLKPAKFYKGKKCRCAYYIKNC